MPGGRGVPGGRAVRCPGRVGEEIRSAGEENRQSALRGPSGGASRVASGGASRAVGLRGAWSASRGVSWAASRGAGESGVPRGAGFPPACAGLRKPRKHSVGTPLQPVKRGKKTSGHGSSDRPDPEARPEISALHEPGLTSRAHERSPMSQVPPHIPPAPGLSESRASAPLPPGAGARFLFVSDATGRRRGPGGEERGLSLIHI